MELSLNLQNKKEIVAEEFLLKDLKCLSLYKESYLPAPIRFLESFIHTKNLNILEKFLALILLRQKCVSDSVSVDTDKGPVSMTLSYIIKNIQSSHDISEEVTINNIKYVLNYPTKFNLGNTDFLFSIIESITIDGERIVVNELTDGEFEQIINSLPKKLYTHLTNYTKKYRDLFTVTIWEEREKINLQKFDLNILTTSFPLFLVKLFNTLSHTEYEELIFVLSKRIPDVNFLINSTYIEIQDYMELYKREVDQINENLQN